MWYKRGAYYLPPNNMEIGGMEKQAFGAAIMPALGTILGGTYGTYQAMKHLRAMDPEEERRRKWYMLSQGALLGTAAGGLAGYGLGKLFLPALGAYFFYKLGTDPNLRPFIPPPISYALRATSDYVRKGWNMLWNDPYRKSGPRQYHSQQVTAPAQQQKQRNYFAKKQQMQARAQTQQASSGAAVGQKEEVRSYNSRTGKVTKTMITKKK